MVMRVETHTFLQLLTYSKSKSCQVEGHKQMRSPHLHIIEEAAIFHEGHDYKWNYTSIHADSNETDNIPMLKLGYQGTLFKESFCPNWVIKSFIQEGIHYLYWVYSSI